MNFLESPQLAIPHLQHKQNHIIGTHKESSERISKIMIRHHVLFFIIHIANQEVAHVEDVVTWGVGVLDSTMGEDFGNLIETFGHGRRHLNVPEKVFLATPLTVHTFNYNR